MRWCHRPGLCNRLITFIVFLKGARGKDGEPGKAGPPVCVELLCYV